MRLGLIFSNDWELFGDGSGDYFEIQHRPLEEMLNIAAQEGVRLTIMAEVAQQWAHRELGLTEPWAARVADAWETLIRDVIAKKSDVQLHIHPQWLKARYEGNRWQLELTKWSIATLSEADIEDSLQKGKAYLEEILRPIYAAYECVVFRAGAYCIEPSSKVIPALRAARIPADTSVTKGLYDPDFYDYRDAVSDIKPWNTSAESVKYEGRGEGVIEFPIHSFPMLESKVLRRAIGAVRSRDLSYRLAFGVPFESADQDWMAERGRIARHRYPHPLAPGSSARTKFTRKLRPAFWLNALLSRQMVQLDYDFVPPNVFVKALSRILERERKTDDLILPIVASGHVKNMHNCDNFERIVRAVNREFGDAVVHWTLRDALDYWQPRLVKSNG